MLFAAGLLVGLLVGLALLAFRNNKPRFEGATDTRQLAETAVNTSPVAPSTLQDAAPTCHDDGPVLAVAARMVRDAHLMARHLGLDHMPDSSRPSVYEVTLAAHDDLEKRAVALLQTRDLFSCVTAVAVWSDGAVRARVDTAVPPPALQ